MLADLSFLTGLHGSIATILICALLVIDEAGVPMWIAPGEVLLIIAGLLIASGAVPVFLFLPLALLAMFGGSWTGYSWAKAVGEAQLGSIANRLKAGKMYERAVRRVGRATTREIFIARLLPGIRPYATLAAGAADVDWWHFMRGNVPALVIWAGVMTTVGYLVGIPAILIVGHVEDLAISGALFVVLGFIAWRAVRRAPQIREAPHPGPFHGIARRDRYVLAAAVDAGIIAVVAAGFDRLTRYVLHWKLPLLPEKTIFEPLTLLALMGLSYILGSRRSRTGETAGERLFDVSYVHPRMAAPHPGEPAPAPREAGTPASVPAERRVSEAP